MTRSIISTELKCYICGKRTCLEEHHIFGGANRKRSEKDGLKVLLCHDCHNEPPNGVHHNKGIKRQLQQIGQRAWMKHYEKTSDEFLAAYGRNYLE